MKTALFLAMVLGVLACSSPASQSKCNLDGKTFQIETFVNGKSDGQENLVFMNGKASNDQCTQYGFGDGAYTCSPDYHFAYTLTSPNEGRMDWDGQVKGEKIEGKMVWVKAGQDDIHYTFSGTEVKK